MGKEVTYPNRVMNQTSDGYEVIPYPKLDGNEANVTAGTNVAELAIPAGATTLFVTPITADVVLKAGTTGITIGAGEGYVVPKNVSLPFLLDADATHVGYKRQADTDGTISYVFA